VDDYAVADDSDGEDAATEEIPVTIDSGTSSAVLLSDDLKMSTDSVAESKEIKTEVLLLILIFLELDGAGNRVMPTVSQKGCL